MLQIKIVINQTPVVFPLSSLQYDVVQLRHPEDNAINPPVRQHTHALGMLLSKLEAAMTYLLSHLTTT